jgi:3-methyladenine DNA glycosylase AlkD
MSRERGSGRRIFVQEAESFFRTRLEANADRENAARQRAYMKSDLEFLGVESAVIRAAAREWVSQQSVLDRGDLRALAIHAFSTSSWDLRSASVAVLERKSKLLREDDLSWLIKLVRIAHAWAHVDWIATKVISFPLAYTDLDAQLRAWARDEDVWVRRTALLSQHDALKRGDGDWDLFMEIAIPMLEEKEFWIRKALGWVMREVSKKRPELVRAFLAEHGEKCSGLTRREASKYLG